MFRRFLVLGALALVCVIAAPGLVHAQRGRGGSHPGFRSSFRPGFQPGFGSFDHRGLGRRDFNREFNFRRFDRFEDRFESRFGFGRFDRFEDRFENRFGFGRFGGGFQPHFTGGFLPGFPGGFLLGF